MYVYMYIYTHTLRPMQHRATKHTTSCNIASDAVERVEHKTSKSKAQDIHRVI